MAVRRLAALAVLLPAVALQAGAGGAAERPPDASATALLARVTLPDAQPLTSGELVAPPATEVSGPFLYPDDGSVVRVGSSTSNVAAQAGTSSSAQALVSALAVSLLGGEVTADSVSVRASAAAGVAGASASGAGSTIGGLVVLGQPVTPAIGQTVPLGDWGTVEVLTTSEEIGEGKARTGTASVTGLRVTLTTDHANLPAGAVVTVGAVSASADAGEAATATPQQPVSKPKPRPAKPKPAPRPAGAPQEPGTSVKGAPPELVHPAPEVTARLTDAGYVFPLFGPASFGDSFGAPRADLASGWHHGEDIIAPRGTPILAVNDGTVFGVGWNDLGGWKLWLRDAAGNEFYYAHLSAYSPLALEGRRVRGGDVLGFVGDSGDAKGTPHLHFEIHPVELLSLGYDGVVAPYPFLVAWRRAEDVSFAAGRRYLGVTGPGRGLAPPAGAVLLEMDDISRTSGLVPGALERAVTVERVDVQSLLSRPS
jgi:murein DD-endopeptidase MepM/ murein hydrolase activator NlpD